VRVFGGVLTSSHDKGECKGHVGVLLTLRVNHTRFLYSG
jgi:hypothetical protein